MKMKTIICLDCPSACVMVVKLDGMGNVVDIEGAKCKKGEEFARSDIKEPKRILTTTVRVMSTDKEHPLLPVKSALPIPIRSINAAVLELAKARISVPVHVGDVIIKDIAGSGIGIVATSERLI